MTAATAGRWLLVVSSAATFVMVGVVWFVQLVHYPAFVRYDRAAFSAAMHEHRATTTAVVVVPMMVELLTAVGLVVVRTPGVPRWAVWGGLALVGVSGFSTVLVQVPLHLRLRDGYDPALIRQLVETNWVRTAAWSARGLMCVGLLLSARPAAR